MNKAYLLLGSNEGNREQWLEEAMDNVAASCGEIQKISSIYETAAWGIEDQAPFLNRVLQIETILSPVQLLRAVNDIEDRLGRQRQVKWGPRTLDIDILLYNDEIIALPELKIPHPYMQDRRFTMAPIDEIAPQLMHPVLHKTMHELLLECPDPLDVHVKK